MQKLSVLKILPFTCFFQQAIVSFAQFFNDKSQYNLTTGQKEDFVKNHGIVSNWKFIGASHS
jgi:hypothetical protein